MTSNERAALAAGAALVITAAPAPAQAAASHGRIERIFGRSNYLIVQAIAASGASNAWLLGLVPDPSGGGACPWCRRLPGG